MGPKRLKSVSEGVVKKNPKCITVDRKKEIIAKHESGVRVSDLALEYDMAKSTICTILKNKDALKKADVSKGVTKLTKQRPQALHEVEKLLLVWINEKVLKGDSVSEALICSKALELYNYLLANQPSTSDTGHVEQFKASRGWFDKFRRRTGIRSVIRHGEAAAATSDQKAAEDFDMLEDHSQKFTLEDLIELQLEQVKSMEEGHSAEERVVPEASTAEIKDVCRKWSEVQAFIEKHHPDKTVTSRAVEILNDNVMTHFRKILQQRKRQISLARILMRLPTASPLKE